MTFGIVFLIVFLLGCLRESSHQDSASEKETNIQKNCARYYERKEQEHKRRERSMQVNGFADY
jgi:hypothetical protein